MPVPASLWARSSCFLRSFDSLLFKGSCWEMRAGEEVLIVSTESELFWELPPLAVSVWVGGDMPRSFLSQGYMLLIVGLCFLSFS